MHYYSARFDVFLTHLRYTSYEDSHPFQVPERNLSILELQAAIASAFKKFDINGDGTISEAAGLLVPSYQPCGMIPIFRGFSACERSTRVLQNFRVPIGSTISTSILSGGVAAGDDGSGSFPEPQ